MYVLLGFLRFWAETWSDCPQHICQQFYAPTFPILGLKMEILRFLPKKGVNNDENWLFWVKNRSIELLPDMLWTIWPSFSEKSKKKKRCFSRAFHTFTQKVFESTWLESTLAPQKMWNYKEYACTLAYVKPYSMHII